jgi:hypothetical protein
MITGLAMSQIGTKKEIATFAQLIFFFGSTPPLLLLAMTRE